MNVLQGYQLEPARQHQRDDTGQVSDDSSLDMSGSGSDLDLANAANVGPLNLQHRVGMPVVCVVYVLLCQQKWSIPAAKMMKSRKLASKI